MKIVKVRRIGNDRVLTIPRHMKNNLKSDWMKVTVSDEGAFIYEPIPASEAI